VEGFSSFSLYVHPYSPVFSNVLNCKVVLSYLLIYSSSCHYLFKCCIRSKLKEELSLGRCVFELNDAVPFLFLLFLFSFNIADADSVCFKSHDFLRW